MSISKQKLLYFLIAKSQSTATHKQCAELIEKVLGKKIAVNKMEQVMQKINTLHKKLQTALKKLHPHKRTVSKIIHLEAFQGNFQLEEGVFEPESLNSSNQSIDENEAILIDDDDNDGNDVIFDDTQAVEPPAKKPKGRPKINEYAKMQGGTKRRYIAEKAEELKNTPGGVDIARVIQSNDERLSGENVLRKISEEDALTLILYKNLTVDTYNAFRQIVAEHGAKILPSYDSVFEYKKKLEPDNIIIDDTKASIPLQDLVNSTSSRLVEIIQPNINETIDYNISNNLLMDTPEIECNLICSWGMDGTTGQSQYHQADSEGNLIEDHSLFVASMTPLKLEIILPGNLSLNLWENPTPGSYLWNRCISLEFAKETDAHTTETYERIQSEINNLTSKVIKCGNRMLKINYEFRLSLIDGKIAKVLNEISSYQRCPCCEASPIQMNRPENFNNDVFKIKTNFDHTIAPLHTILGVCRCLFNIAIRKSINTWRVSKANQLKLSDNKAYYKRRIFEAFHIRYDEPRDGGRGTSTTGNVCRKMLQDPKKLAEVLELDEKFVTDIATVLLLISSKSQLYVDMFSNKCRETYNRYIELYSWYYMPVSMHKVLVHGAEIMTKLPLSFGMLTEEGPESRNKLYRRFRQYNARKTSRKDNMHDVFVRSLLSSDPKFAIKITGRIKLKKSQDLDRLLEKALPYLVVDEEEEEEENVQENNILEILDENNDDIFDFDENE